MQFGDMPSQDETGVPDAGPQDHEFAVLLAEQTVTIKDAYSRAYPEKASMYATATDSALRQAAARRARDKDIQKLVSYYQLTALEAAKCSVEQHMADLLRLREKALADGKHAAAVNAEIARGKAAGLYVERIEVGDNTTDPTILYARARDKLGQEAADRWAIMRGYNHLVDSADERTIQ